MIYFFKDGFSILVNRYPSKFIPIKGLTEEQDLCGMLII